MNSSEQSYKAIKSATCLLSLSVFLLVLTEEIAADGISSEAPPDAGALMQMSFDELLEVNLKQVYGASKYLQPITDAPSSVSIVEATQIKRFGYRTLGEILQGVRGLYVSNDRNYSYLGVRGFLRPGDNTSRVLLLINGHRINDNVFDSALIGNAFPLDVDLIERVEIIRGPSSALYGNSAFFAVINVVTKDAKSFHHGEASAEAGNLGTYRTRFTFSDGFKNGASLLISGTYFDQRGNPKLYYPEFDDPATNFGIARRRDWDQFQSYFAQYKQKSISIDAGFHLRETGIPTAPFGTIFNHSDNETQDLTAYINARHQHEFDEDLHLNSRLTYGHYNYDGVYVYEGEDPGDPLVPNFDEARGRWLVGETTLRKQIANRHQLIAGFEYRFDITRDQTNFDRSPPFVYLDSRDARQIWSPYATMELNLRTNILVNAGIRHDQYETFGGTTNPRISLIYKARPKTTLKYVYGEAFRAPNAFEHYYGDSGFTAKPNPNLEPETIATHELIWEERLSPSVLISSSVYQYDIDDLITQIRDPADGLLVYENEEAIRATGVEFEVQGSFSSGMTGRASYAYQSNEDLTEGTTLFNSPRHLAKFQLNVPLIKDQIYLGWESLYTSSRNTIGGPRVEGFWLQNITLFTQSLRPGLELSASVYNLFDEQFFDPGGPEHEQVMIERNGRTFRIKLTYRF